MQSFSLGVRGIADLPELTNDAVEFARWNPEIGCLVDRVEPGAPLIVSFGFAEWQVLPRFDFFGRIKKLEARSGRRFNRLLVRDIRSRWYHRGVPGLGEHVDEVATSLRGLVRSIRPARVITIGQSMGGFAAILFGMLLGADQVIAFGPISHLDPDEANRFGDHQFLHVMDPLVADPPKSGYYDLTKLGERLGYRGRMDLIFGTGSHQPADDHGNLDAIHALRMARLPNVTLHPYPESNHLVLKWLVDQKRIDDLLTGLLPVDDSSAWPARRGS